MSAPKFVPTGVAELLSALESASTRADKAERRLAEQDKWLSDGVYFTTEEYKAEVQAVAQRDDELERLKMRLHEIEHRPTEALVVRMKFDYDELNTKYKALYKAAHVIVQTPATRRWLEQNDPRALAQVKHAIKIADRE